jgi:kynurenine formamidase
MVGQYGTHVDPPAHFAEDGITMDKIRLKQMILPLIVLDDTPHQAKDENHRTARCRAGRSSRCARRAYHDHMAEGA